MSFGNELKAAREAQALGVQDVAARIKVRADYLRALEAESLSALPERTFTRAYLQSYARALNLDPAPLLRDFDRLSPQPAEQVNTLKRPGKDLPKTRRSPGTGLVGGTLAALVVLAVAGYFGYSAYQSRSTLAASAQDSAAAQPTTRQVRLDLSSTPAGAQVYVDNGYLGQTPITDFPLNARSQATLRVEYGGRQTYQQTLSLDSDRHLNISLLPLTAAQLAAQAAAVKQAQTAASQKTASQKAAASQSATAQAGTGTSTRSTGTPSAAPQTAATVTSTTATSATAQTAPAQATPTAAPTAAPASGVRLNWAGASWTRVTSSGGQVLYEGIPSAGSSRDFPSGVTVRTGSAGLVTATVSGGQPQRLGAVGAVVTRTF